MSEVARVRLGVTMQINVPVLTDGDEVSLVGRNISAIIVAPNRKQYMLPFTIDGEHMNKVKAVFEGMIHEVTGLHRIMIVENLGKESQTLFDMDAVNLVARSSMASALDSSLPMPVVQLSGGSLFVGGKGGEDGVGISSIQFVGHVTGGNKYKILLTSGAEYFFLANDGQDGQDGHTPYIQDKYWYINGESTGIKADYSDEEAARQSAYQAAEANRNGAYEDAENDRDEDFVASEAQRQQEFTQAEAARNTSVQAAQAAAEDAAESAQEAVQKFNAIKDAIDALDPSQSTSDAIVAEAAARSAKDAELESTLGQLGQEIYDVSREEILTATPALRSVKTYADTIVAGNRYLITFSNVGEGSKIALSIGSSSSTAEQTPLQGTVVTEGLTVEFIPTVSATHWRAYVQTAACTFKIERMISAKERLLEMEGYNQLEDTASDLSPFRYIHYNNDNADTDNYYRWSASAGARGYFVVDVSESKDWEASISIDENSTIKGSLGFWTTGDVSTRAIIYDSGWLSPGSSTSKTYSNYPTTKFVAFTFTYNDTGKGQPSIDEILQYVTFNVSQLKVIGTMLRSKVEDMLKDRDTLKSWGTQLVNTKYIGNKITITPYSYDIKKYSYTFNVIGTIAGSGTMQGGAVYGDYLFQFHSAGAASVAIYNLATKTNVQTVSGVSMGHAGSGGFSLTFYDPSDPFPLLYISDMNNKKIFVFRITGEDGSYVITQIQVITLATEYYLPNVAVDVPNDRLVLFGYTKNSWSDATDNLSVIFTCRIPSYESDVTISEFANVFHLPFIYAMQGAFAQYGKLYLSYGATNQSAGAGIMVIDYITGNVDNIVGVLAIARSLSMTNLEPEALCAYNGTMILTAPAGRRIFQLVF